MDQASDTGTTFRASGIQSIPFPKAKVHVLFALRAQDASFYVYARRIQN